MGGSAFPNFDVKHLQDVCVACSRLRAQPEEGGDWSAVFTDRPENFVDIYRPVDPYQEEFWATASAYFGSLS